MIRRILAADLTNLVVVGLLAQMLTLVSGPLVARMLGPSGRGETATILAVALTCNQLLLTSLGHAVSRTVALETGSARDTVGGFLPLWIGLCGFSGAAGAGVTVVVLRHSPHLLSLAPMGFAVTFMAGVLVLVRSMAMGDDRIKRVVVADVSFTVVYVATVTLLFVVDRHSTPALVMLAFLIAQVVSLVLMVRALAPATGAPTSAAVRTEVHRFARSAYFSSIGTLDRLGLDTIIVGQLLGTALLGLYSVASSITTLPAVMVGALAGPLLPKMVARTPIEAASLMRRWVAAVTLLCVPVVVTIWLIVRPALDIFFGRDFVPATTTSRLLLIANTAFALRLMFTAAAQAQNRERRASWISLFGGIAVLGCLAVGAQLHGLNGAAVGVAAGALASAAASAANISWSGRGVTTAPVVSSDVPSPGRPALRPPGAASPSREGPD